MARIADKNKRYPEGHFLGVGMAIGIAIFSGVFVTLSLATENPGLIGVGPAIGTAFGLAIGKAMEERYRQQGMIRPLTKKEKESRRKGTMIGLAAVIIGALTLIALLLLTP